MTELTTTNISNNQISYDLRINGSLVLSTKVHKDTKVTLENMMSDFLQISELENQKNIQKISELDKSIGRNLKLMKIVNLELGNV